MLAKKILIILISILIVTTSLAGNQLIHYEPEIVRLEGIVETQVFPGPPNYCCIKDGDRIERGPYLRLDKPADVDLISNAEIFNNEPERNVKIMQIVVWNQDHWKLVKNGNHVEIIGTLYHRSNGHHHSRVLIKTEQVRITPIVKTEHENI